MYIHYPGNSLGLRWTIYRGLSRITEDFESATLTCFLFTKDNKFPVEATVMSAADGGSYLYIELSPELQLPDGIYGVSAIWKKNEDRSIARSMREGLFSVVNNQEEATDQGGAANIPVLKFHSSAGTFGYDGLSAYELALLKGLTTKSETEWVQEQLDIATDQIFDAKDEAVGQAETAITAAKDVAVGQAEDAVVAAKDAAVSAANTAIGESKENALDAIAEAIEGLEVHYDIETDKGTVKDVQLKDGQGNSLMPKTDAEVVDVVDTELSYTTLVSNKYINKNGVEVSLNGQTYGYGEIGDVKKVRVKWASISNIQNYSLIAFYASDDFTQTPISKLVGVNGVTTGEAIVDVPEGAVYFAYSMPTKVALTVYTSDALTYVKEMRKELMNLGLDYNHFDELELVERVASTYLGRGGGIVYSTSWSAYTIRVYAVVPGQVVYFYQPVPWNTGFAVYGFANSYANGTQCKAYESDISQSVTPKYDGSFKRLVVPDECQYLIVNELAAAGDKAFSHIKVLGTPRHVDLHKVKNYNPCFDLSSPVWAQQMGSLDQWISGLGCSYSGDVQLKYPIVMEDSNGVFADTDATHYLECLQQMRVGPGCRFFYMYSKDFSNTFRKYKTLRVEFDLQIDSDAPIAIKFNSYCYLNGSASGLGGGVYEQTFQPGVVTHVDRIFYYSNLPLENGFIQFNLVNLNSGQLTHVTSVKIANLVITDDVPQLNIPTQEAYRSPDWLGRNKYFNKRCLFLGDSISTGDNWVWKNVLNWRYGLRSEERKSDSDMSIAPAEGSITIACYEGGLSRNTSNKYSIWYKCANTRMNIYDFDVISLFGGTNDAWWDETLYPGGVGTADDVPYVDDASTFADPSKYTDVYSDNLTFMQFYKGCIEMLRRDFPDKELILSTLFPLNSNYRLDYQITAGKTCRRDEWVSYLILQVARKYNLKCNAWYWNMYPPAGWSGNVNIGAIIHHDGVHPSVVDGYMMADRFATALGC